MAGRNGDIPQPEECKGAAGEPRGALEEPEGIGLLEHIEGYLMSKVGLKLKRILRGSNDIDLVSNMANFRVAMTTIRSE
jgi:hypothetical protein